MRLQNTFPFLAKYFAWQIKYQLTGLCVSSYLWTVEHILWMPSMPEEPIRIYMYVCCSCWWILVHFEWWKGFMLWKEVNPFSQNSWNQPKWIFFKKCLHKYNKINLGTNFFLCFEKTDRQASSNFSNKGYNLQQYI